MEPWVRKARGEVPKDKRPWWWSIKSKCCDAEVILDAQQGRRADIKCSACKRAYTVTVPVREA